MQQDPISVKLSNQPNVPNPKEQRSSWPIILTSLCAGVGFKRVQRLHWSKHHTEENCIPGRLGRGGVWKMHPKDKRPSTFAQRTRARQGRVRLGAYLWSISDSRLLVDRIKLTALISLESKLSGENQNQNKKYPRIGTALGRTVPRSGDVGRTEAPTNLQGK